MKTIMKVTIAVLILIGVGITHAEPVVPEAPDVEYEIVLSDQSDGTTPTNTITTEIWAQSYAEHGISCAFVNLTTNLPVVGIVYGEDYTVLQGGEIDDEGVENLGGCTFFPGGTGQDEWSLVATVDMDSSGAKRVTAYLGEPTHQSLVTSIYGEGFARVIDYGKVLRSRIYSPRESKPERKRGNSR